MMTKEITIGRNGNCDIILGNVCVYASHMHATMYMDGWQLMYRDHSRNGTIINNNMVHNRAVPVEYGDTIMIAGQYQLSWNQIEEFFPRDQHPVNNPNGYDVPTSQGYSTENSLPKMGWNWGAFMLYPIWGFWNGCWWGILIAFFFGWTIIPNFIFGACGSSWAWSNRQWRDADEFNQMQAAWRPWGIAIFVINILFVLFTFIFGFALLSAIFS